MSLDLTPVVNMIAGLWLDAFAVFLRVGAVIFLAPGFGERVLPMRLRLGVAFAYTIVVLPAAGAVQGVSLWTFAPAEFATGLCLGVLLRLVVIALQMAAAIAAQSSSLAQMFGGAEGEPAAAYGHLTTMAGIAIAFALGLHLALADYLIGSFNLVPLGRPLPAEVIATGVLEAVEGSFALGFRLALPFVLAALLYNLTLGLINRAMPQLMVIFIGAPALTLGGLALMMLVTPLMISRWTGAMGTVLDGRFGSL